MARFSGAIQVGDAAVDATHDIACRHFGDLEGPRVTAEVNKMVQ